MTFDAVPAGRTLEATNINCTITTSSPADQPVAARVLQANTPKATFVGSASKGAAAFNEQIRVFFAPRVQPRAQGFAEGRNLLTCTLSGTLLK
jgi:hypothetical protein